MNKCIFTYGVTLKGKRHIYELEIRVSYTQETGGLQLFSNTNSGETHPHYLKMVFEMFIKVFCHIGLMEQGT